MARVYIFQTIYGFTQTDVGDLLENRPVTLSPRRPRKELFSIQSCSTPANVDVEELSTPLDDVM